MPTGSSGTSFMTGDKPESTPPAEVQRDIVEERQLAGYRIFDHKPVEQVKKEQEVRKRALRHLVTDRTLQTIDYVFVLLYAALTIRLLLTAVEANPNAGFVRFIGAVTQPFYAPFVDIIPSPGTDGGEFELPILICMIAYLLLHVALRQLVHLVSGVRPAVPPNAP
jgi:hypothetical protein